jgi:ABC-type Na+ efflux pump permease subunit
VRLLLAVTCKDLRRFLSDPVSVGIWFGIPLGLAGLLYLVLGGRGGIAFSVQVLLVDEDQSFFSELLTDPDFAQLNEFMDIEVVSRELGLAEIEAGRATALLLIPQGFEQAVIAGDETELTLLTNPTQEAFADLVQEIIEVIVETVFYVQQARLVSTNATTEPSPVPQDCGSGDSGSLVSQIGCNLPRLHGPVLSTGIFLDSSSGPQPDRIAGHLVSLFLPGLLFLSVLFIVRGISGDIWREKAGGTLRRTLCSPNSHTVILLGKIVTAITFVGAVTLATLALDSLFIDLEPDRLLLAFTWCIFSGVALLHLFFLVQFLAPSQREASLLSTLILLPLLMIGGSFIPLEMMPVPLATAGRLTPNGLALARLKEILSGGGLDPTSLWVSAALLALFTFVSFVFCQLRLRRGFAVSS